MSNIVNTSITFLNHSSVLLEHKSTVIFTDPFYDKPAFETWAPSPPCATNPAYLLAMSKSGNNFAIMVSHGHDDHCDDRLLKLFNHCTIIITKFSSPGLRNRITSLGYTKIIEIDEEPIKFHDVELSAFINEKRSHDDSLQVINFPDLTFVHANDCWWSIDDKHLKIINSIKKNKVHFASQITVADGYPFAYTSFTEKACMDIVRKMTVDRIISALTNAQNLNADNFIHYAGHVKIFSTNERVNQYSGFVEDKFNMSKISNFIPSDITFISLMKPILTLLNIFSKTFENSASSLCSFR